jgi:hypothetical protein
LALFRFMVIDEDGQRLGRFETGHPQWRAGNTFAFQDKAWRIVEVLPEVSTMIAYNAVWVAAPANDEDELAALDETWTRSDERESRRVEPHG